MRQSGVALLLLPVMAAAQIELPEPGGSTASAAVMAAPAAANPTAELFNQLQQLQQEVMALRGTVEEQAEQIRQLKQQRMDDYLNMDRRLSALSSGGVQTNTASGSVTLDPGATAASATGGLVVTTPPATMAQPGSNFAVNAAIAEAEYKTAYELVRARDFAAAIESFHTFIGKYPGNDLSGNAHYWLGELYLVEGDSETATRHFEALMAEYPSNRKVPDGMFKLGRIYHQRGDLDRAREILQRVISEYGDSGSSSPRLAEEYLKQNF